MPDGMLEERFLWEGPLDEVSQRAVAHVERFKIQNALRESKWNKTRAAEKLGVSYKTLLTKIRRTRPRELAIRKTNKETALRPEARTDSD